ncbi:putative non-specific serine/threonine protein kinase [Rosa chinensis]|uniref:Putative non-specific serine/threonine protein kinase n=1 Tax=Rosa chinensis TaxID=74649 RepID=A0A2P6SE25_ROSCH|nr:putative non-specific serine/threonine protein kinase [Rosa chinensis]
MGTNAIKYASVPVSFMTMNGTGLYLLGNNGSEAVFHFLLELSDMSFAKLDSSGILYRSNIFERIWFSDIDKCQYPEACGKMGLCANQTCTCPTGFSHVDSEKDLECVQQIKSRHCLCLLLVMKVGMFTEPVKLGASLSICQSLCSQNCTCLAFFHGKSSGSCYLVENNLGFIIYSSNSQEDRIGYIKAVGPWSGHEKHSIPVLHLVMIMTMLLIVTVVMRLIWWRKKKHTRASVDVWNLSSSAELEISSIPGLPIRFNYEELVTATENFNTQNGSGGFSTIYKGTILDNNAVAVKKITSLGVRGKESFTKTATMGSI